MGTVDQKEATEGYVAVTTNGNEHPEHGICYCCAFNYDTNCNQGSSRCHGVDRRDGQEVIFKVLEEKEYERDQH